ncbi:asl5033 [Nostoc sp. PCC 7120 = FACHB-418]|nr:asl5033 [Nostoc sp. PCC 7120 = FACHB-418]
MNEDRIGFTHKFPCGRMQGAGEDESIQNTLREAKATELKSRERTKIKFFN